MMSSKRALVVDDSKSARAFLARILERHEITVDSAESAEAAIEYLARNKPDVIFMDHMMPGMDGFQAVQTIKNNPRTSAIPILMYTSQEGDLYAGQARALGADGVLPKQIKQADVTKMLFQLRLVSDRRGDDQTTFARMAPAADLFPANESSIVVSAPPAAAPVMPAAPGAEVSELLPKLSLEIRAAVDQTLRKEIAALRSHFTTSLDTHAERLQGDLAALLPARATPDIDATPLVPDRRSWGAITGWTCTLLAIAGGAFMSWQWWNRGGELAAVRTDLDAAYAEVETLRARVAVVSPAGAAAMPVEPFAAGAAPVESGIAAAPDAPEPAAAGEAPAGIVHELVRDGAAPLHAPAASAATTSVAPAPVAADVASAAQLATAPVPATTSTVPAPAPAAAAAAQSPRAQ
jgi:CheY-like chemotaxis protein